jgi:hypothetical protein
MMVRRRWDGGGDTQMGVLTRCVVPGTGLRVGGEGATCALSKLCHRAIAHDKDNEIINQLQGVVR